MVSDHILQFIMVTQNQIFCEFLVDDKQDHTIISASVKVSDLIQNKIGMLCKYLPPFFSKKVIF